MEPINQPALRIKVNRLNKRVLKLQSGMSYVLGDDELADIRLKNVNASVYEENGRWILMNLTEENLKVNEENLSSVTLRKNLQIQLGKYEIEYFLLGEKASKRSTQQIDSDTVLRSISIVLFAIAFLIMILGKKQSSEEPENHSIDQSSTNVQGSTGLKNEPAAPDNQNNEVNLDDIDNISSPMNPQAHRLYQLAVGYYDQGRIKKALQTVLQAASLDPQNRLINNKISDWESKLDKELTRYYRQGCFDLKYLRYYEAEHLFQTVQGLSYDLKDPRFIESKRILSALKAKNYDRLTCGAK